MSALIMALIFLSACAYLISGFYFMCMCSWAIGMPDHMCRTPYKKIERFLLKWSMTFAWPIWIVVIFKR